MIHRVLGIPDEMRVWSQCQETRAQVEYVHDMWCNLLLHLQVTLIDPNPPASFTPLQFISLIFVLPWNASVPCASFCRRRHPVIHPLCLFFKFHDSCLQLVFVAFFISLACRLLAYFSAVNDFFL